MNVWQSKLDKTMTKHLTEGELSTLIEELNKAVENICESYEVK